MKLFNSLVGIILFCFASFVSPTTINGRFTVVDYTSSKFTVLVQINTNTGTDDIGGATIVFSFDSTSINFTNNPIKDVDYVFHNFSDGTYSPATVTKPMNDKIWINIDLPFNNNNNGTVVAGSPEWTDVVTLNFDILDLNGTASLSWLTTSLFWGIYDADNFSLFEVGEFENLLNFPFITGITSLIVPEKFDLSQNYPNPFNPSTKITVSLPQASTISLAVYNLIGEKVSEIAEGEYEAGTHEFTFNPSGLSSGIYIYRIESSDFIDTKKMVLLK